MESPKIRRGIESPHARTASDALRLGRVTRLRDAETLEGGRRFQESDKHRPEALALIAARNRVILTWSLVLSLTVLVVVGGFMMFWLRSHRSLKSQSQAERSDQSVRIASKFVSPSEDAALDQVKRALANRDPAKVPSLFHLGEATPQQVVEFIADSPTRDGWLERSIWLSSMDVEGLLMEGVLVMYAGKKGPGERLAFLTPDAAGVWKVDFEAFARISRPSWMDLFAGRADSARVRVLVAKDAYFNGPFRDESQWLCFGMVSPESKELLPEDKDLLHGYCRVGSPQAKAMARIFANGEWTNRATLEIRRTKGADSRQFEITRVLAEDWVVPPKPLDERFE